ncbi:MAG: hypothetical protein ACI37Z_06320 [Candidatus Gastranaerophilaceae bacterium]
MVAIGNLYANKIQTLQVAQMVKSGQIDESQLSLFSETTGISQGMLDGSCTDGADDGKISFGEGAKSFLKGAVKSLVPTSFGDFLKKAAIGVGCAALVAVTGGAATPFLIAGGAIAGGIQAGKGIYNASQARTDAEAKAAMEDVGGGTATVAMSVVAGKAYTKSTGNALIGKGSLSTYKNAAAQSVTNTKANFGKLTTSAKNAATKVKTDVKASFENFKTKAAEAKTTATKAAETTTSPFIEQPDGQLAFNLDDVSTPQYIEQPDGQFAFNMDDAVSVSDDSIIGSADSKADFNWNNTTSTTTTASKLKGFGNRLVHAAKSRIEYK